jgi:endonuclease/exonuclease/phosphatase family metal-dependent hydrolase
LLVAAALLLWLLAQPRPGLRIVRLTPVLAPEEGAPGPAVPDRIRIATYNLEHFTDGRRDEPERTPEVFMTHAREAAAIIAEANPDILVLQEIENGRTLEFLNEQFATPYAYLYISKLRQTSGEKERLNLALLSRLRPHNVRQLGFYNLGGKGRPARGSLAAEFALGDGSNLLVYDIHLKSNYGEAPRNRAQRAIALHHIAADVVSETLQNDPDSTSAIILGDTNVDPDTEAFAADPSLEPLAGSYVDLWRGRPIEERTTIPTRQAGETGDPLLVFPPAAFDRLFVSKNLAANGPWRAGRPETIQKGADTTNNLTQPGFNGHVSDHHIAYVDLSRNPDYAPPPPPAPPQIHP